MNKPLLNLLLILTCITTAQAWKVDKDGTTQMKLTDTGRLWIGADGKYGKPKMAVTTTESDEDRALDVRTERTTGWNFGIVATAVGNGADVNIGLYGYAAKADKNYGLYVESGYGYFIDRVGIGTDSPSEMLQIDGKGLADAWNTNSDRRLKKDIHPLKNSLEKVSKLQGVTYKWKDINKSQKPQIGFIAQDVEKVVPEVVSKPKNVNQFYNMQYDRLTALLVEAVKDLKKQNDSLKTLVCQDHPDADICIEPNK